jgi:hypothetical protein
VAISAKPGTFTKRAGTGTQSITGVGFTPKAILFWWSDTVAAVSGFSDAGLHFSYGFSDGTNHKGCSQFALDAANPTSCGRGWNNAKCIVLITEGGVADTLAHVSAFGADGFTLDFTTNGAAATGATVHYLALGGADLSVNVGDAAIPTSTGSHAVTGVGFKPSVVILGLYAAANATIGSADARADGFGSVCLGWMTALAQGTLSVDTQDATTPTSGAIVQRTDRAIHRIRSADEVTSHAATRVSLDTDGFTLSWLAVESNPGRLPYLALSGVVAKVMSGTQPSSATTERVTAGDAAFTPVVAIAMSCGQAASTGFVRGAGVSFGVAEGTASPVEANGTWTGETDATAAAQGAQYESTTVPLSFATPAAAGASSTLDAQASIAFSQGGLDVTWTAGGSDIQVLYLALGERESPADYEDPCSIVQPRLHVKIETEDETLHYGVTPIRDSAANGGFKQPRVIDVGPCIKAASDLSTGAWSAQTATARLADTDRVNRERSRVRTSFRNCDAEVYVASKTRQQAGGAPRILFSGKVYHDQADEHLVLSLTINDLIGNTYSLFSEEKMIPQRQTEITYFPNIPEENLGQGESILGGSLYPLRPDEGEGVVPCVTVGRITIGGTAATPTGLTLAALLALLQTSKTAGTLYQDWGGKLGYGDMLSLQAYSGSILGFDYDALAYGTGTFIGAGAGDVDAVLNEEAVTGGNEYVAALVASHAISAIRDGENGDPSVWIDDLQLDPAQLGVQWWCPQITGDTTWSSTFGSDRSTDILSTDGVTTRRYTLVLFDPGSTYGDLVEAGGTVHLDCDGMETIGNGTGSLITDYFELYRHILINFLLGNYHTGSWLASPTFLFADGVTNFDRVHEASFDTASDVAALNTATGDPYQGGPAIIERTSVRDVIKNFNFSGGCQLAEDDYGRLFVKVLDRRRETFLDDHRTIRDKVDILPGFRIEPRPEWQANWIAYQYSRNYHTNVWERRFGGGGSVAPVQDATSQTRDGVIKKTIEFPYVRHDETADAVAHHYLRLFANLPRVVRYARRGLCSLEDGPLQGVPITHYNGYGTNGWTDHAVWTLQRTFYPKTLHSEFLAFDMDGIDGLLVSDQDDAVDDALLLDPLATEALFSDDAGVALTVG